jgi:hypothetical protein
MYRKLRSPSLARRILLTLGVLACSSFQLSAQSFGSNLGSLSYSTSEPGYTCTESSGRTGSYSEFRFTNFVYTPVSGVSGGNQSLAGTAYYVNRSTGGGGTCPPVGPHPADLVGNGFTIYFLPASNGSHTATISSPGYVNGKYVVVGVLYAPPGHSSNVNYTTSNLVSSTVTTKSTFFTGYTETTTELACACVKAWKYGEIDTSVQNSQSYTNSTTTTDSTAVTIQKTTSNYVEVPGPVCDYCGVDHDYDLIAVWLNPVILYTLSNDGVVQANGYGFSSLDQPGVDVYYVYAGELNGDLPMRSSTTTAFNRSWATAISWPTGGPALTAQDEQNILKMDPFWNCTYQSPVGDAVNCPEPATTSFVGTVNTTGTAVTWVTGTTFSNLLSQIVISGITYTVSQVNSPTSLTLESSAGTQTSASYSAPSRFTQPTSASFPYQQPEPGGQPIPTGYTWSYSNTFTTGTDVTVENDQTVGYEYAFGASVFGVGFKITIDQSSTMKFIYETSSQFTSTSTSTAAATLAGPDCAVVGSVCNPIYPPSNAFNPVPVPCTALSSATAFGQGDNLYIYQDNLFGTFLMEPYGQP